MSTSVYVRNSTGQDILAKLTWGLGGGMPVSSATVAANGGSAQLPCEYVWYDLRIFVNNVQVQVREGVYGGASRWVVHLDNAGQWRIDWDNGEVAIDTFMAKAKLPDKAIMLRLVDSMYA